MKRVVGFGAATQQGDWPLQEDAYWIDPAQGIFVLADGFGGKDAGDKAAAAAVLAAGEFLASEARAAIAEDKEHPYFSAEEAQVAQAFRLAGEAVLKLNEGRDVEVRGGVAMVIAYFLSSGRAVLGNLGNTGAAILREGKSILILPPQSLAANRGEVVGKMDARFGEDFPLQFLGLFTRVEPDIRTFHFHSRDHVLLFSEGYVRGKAEVLGQAAVLTQADLESRGDSEMSLRLEDLAKSALDLSGSGEIGNKNRSLILVEAPLH